MSPGLSPYCPDGQLEQEELPICEYLPAGQMLGTAVPVPHEYPAGHVAVQLGLVNPVMLPYRPLCMHPSKPQSTKTSMRYMHKVLGAAERQQRRRREPKIETMPGTTHTGHVVHDDALVPLYLPAGQMDAVALVDLNGQE